MANRKNTFLIKRSNVAGKIPAAGDLQLGELALNTADNILYASGTTANSILPIGWDRVSRTGDTMTGGLFTPSITATTISGTSINKVDYIVFNTGTTSAATVAGTVYFDNNEHALSYNTSINQGVTVNLGQQNYLRVFNNSGVDIQRGKALEVLSAYSGLPSVTLAVNKHTGFNIIGVSAEIIPNNSEGIVITNGIISNIELTGMSVGSLVYASDSVAGKLDDATKYLSFPLTARTNQIGFVVQTGVTTGKLFIDINNENSVLSLTDLERNVLEGNTISTGAFEFTGMTTASTTTFNIAPLKGWLVKNTYEYALTPDVQSVNYTGGTNISVTNIGTADSTYVLINSGLTVTQQTTFPTPQQRRENIYLGKVNHPNRTSILNINNTVDYDVSPMSSLRDLWAPIRLINQGIIPSPNGANRSFNTSAGTLWGNGINWHNNQLSPNNVNIAAKVPASFFYRTQTGGTSSSVTVIDPTKYDIGGVITSISPAGSNDATNQRIYLYPTGVINVLYGQTRYATLAAAIAAIQSETFIPYPNAESTGILIGVISVRNDIVADGQPLTNPDYAKFTLVSKFGESFGGTGGLSTTTLQQAYNNSTTPEIVINATLDGLSIQNGTGNADNTTHLIQGLNTAGNTTSFIRADGYISGTTFQSNGFRANNDGVTATTVSATTYINLPIDVRVTGGTYAAGTATFINNTGGTFTVTGFSTGGTVTGPTTFTNGLTANTISATTIQTPSLIANSTGLNVTGSINNTISGQTLSTSYNSPVNRLDINSNVNLGFQAGASGGIFFYVNGSASDRSLWLHPSSAVLIGNPTATSPNATLHVTNVGTPNSFLVEDSDNPDGTPFVIDAIGNVGVGTLAPLAKLHVHEPTILGTTGGSYSLLTTVEGNGSGNAVYNNLYTYRDANGSDWLTTRIHDSIGIDNTYKTPGVDTRTWYERDPYNSIHSWGSSSITYMTITLSVSNTAGNVGIGTTTPSASLHINNADNQNSFLVEDTNPDSSPFVIDANGNVGMGTLTPTEKLVVNGNAIITGSITVTGGTQSLFSGNSSVEMVKIIQAGSGDAFVVQDQANGDSSHFIINASGNTAIGLTAPIGNDKLTVSGNTTIYGTFSASTYAGLPNAGVLVVPIATSSVAVGTGSNDYYLNFKIPYNLTISKVDFSVSTAGSDSVRIGIYRGQDLTAVLVGQSAGGTVSTLNSVPIVAEVGQNLTFSAGSWIVIGVAVGGTTTNLYGSACPVNNLIAWTNTTDSSGGFPTNPRSKAATRTSFPSIEITVA